MFGIFKTDDSVALSIEPSLRFLSVGTQTKVIIDSGDEDLNQRIAQTVLSDAQSQGVGSIYIEGFDKIYTAFEPPKSKTTTIKTDATDHTATDPIATEPTATTELTTTETVAEHDYSLNHDILARYLKDVPEASKSAKLTRIKTQIADAFEYGEGVIIGSIYLSLSCGEPYLIANPIYTVIPMDAKDGTVFVEINAIQTYIEDEWTDEFAYALMTMVDQTAVNDSGVVSSPKLNSDLSSSFRKAGRIGKDKYLLPMLALLSILSVGIAGATIGGVLSANVEVASSASAFDPNDSGKSYNYSNHNDPNHNNQNHNGKNYSAVGVINVSSQQPQRNDSGIPSAEEYAALQTQATQDLLKQMNVNLANTPADLGCLTQ